MQNIQAISQRKPFRIFGRAEYKELHKILSKSEEVFLAAYGFYSGGSGLLVVTNYRVLLLDKQPFYLNLEDMRYEHITRVELFVGKLQTGLKVCTGTHTMSFKSLSDARLKQMYYFVQARSELKTSHLEQLIDVAAQGRFKPSVFTSEIPALFNSAQPANTLRTRPTKFYPLYKDVRIVTEK